MRIKLICLLLFIYLLFSCDLFVKKNPEDFSFNQTGKISYIGSMNISSAALLSILVSNDNKTIMTVNSSNEIFQGNIENGFINNIVKVGDLNVPTRNIINSHGIYFYTINSSPSNLINFFIRDNGGMVKNKGQINIGSNTISTLVVTPDGGYLYVFYTTVTYCDCFFINNDGSLIYKNSNSLPNFGVANTVFSSDGNYLYFTLGTDCYQYSRDTHTGKLTYIKTYNGNFNNIISSHNQKLIYNLASDGSLNFFDRDINSGNISSAKSFNTGTFNYFALSYDDKVIYCTNGSNFCFIDTENKNYTILPFNGLTISNIAVCPSDDFIYLSAYDGSQGCILIFKRSLQSFF